MSKWTAEDDRMLIVATVGLFIWLVLVGVSLVRWLQ